MPAAYDNYDYPSYWKGREYEHASELLALKSFLSKIPKVGHLMEIGVGYGRLTPTYLNRAKKITLVDPSAKLLKIARRSFQNHKKIKYIQGNIESIKKKIYRNSLDVIVMVRVLHHIRNIDIALSVAQKSLKKGGYFILEVANKNHFKAVLSELIKGNLTYLLDIFPKDRRSATSIKNDTIPFNNLNPDFVCFRLEDYGFSIIEKRSVSNIRSEFLKKHLPLDFNLQIETKLQRLLSIFNFGPSVFILAKLKK